MSLQTHYERLEGGRLRVARLGRGPHLVLLHGYPETLNIFERLAPRLAERFEVLAFDWPGMGQSDEWSGGASPVQMADRLIRVLDHFGIASATLFGTDMGGQPALVAAADCAERVDRLVVSNSLVLWDEATSWEIRVLRRHGWNRLVIEWLPWLVFRRAEASFLSRSTRLPAALRAEFWRCFRRRQTRRFISRMCAGYQGLLPRLPDWYARVRAPTLVLWGERDRHFPPQHGQRLAERVAGARLEVVPGAEHWMVWSRADEVAARTLSWVAATTSPGAQ